jgi:hypothetical protein
MINDPIKNDEYYKTYLRLLNTIINICFLFALVNIKI